MLRVVAVRVARTVAGDLNFDGFDERRFFVRGFLPAFGIELLDEIGHAVFNGKNHLLQIRSLDHHQQDGIDQHEIRAAVAVRNDIQQQVVTERIDQRRRAANSQPMDFVLRPKGKVVVPVIAAHNSALRGGRSSTVLCQQIIFHKSSRQVRLPIRRRIAPAVGLPVDKFRPTIHDRVAGGFARVAGIDQRPFPPRFA
jgi:hypothetical protein